MGFTFCSLDPDGYCLRDTSSLPPRHINNHLSVIQHRRPFRCRKFSRRTTHFASCYQGHISSPLSSSNLPLNAEPYRRLFPRCLSALFTYIHHAAMPGLVGILSTRRGIRHVLCTTPPTIMGPIPRRIPSPPPISRHSFRRNGTKPSQGNGVYYPFLTRLRDDLASLRVDHGFRH